MEEFENLQGFLEHISLVMDADGGADAEAVSIMTCIPPRGSNSTPCSCPAGRKACSRTSARSTTRAAPASRRSAASPMSGSRARAGARTSIFASNRRMHGLWSSNLPSRFLDELPEANVEVTEAKGGFGSYGRRQLRRLALRRHDAFRLELPDAGLAARAEAHRPAPSGFEDESQDYDDDARTPTTRVPRARARPSSA